MKKKTDDAVFSELIPSFQKFITNLNQSLQHSTSEYRRIGDSINRATKDLEKKGDKKKQEIATQESIITHAYASGSHRGSNLDPARERLRMLKNELAQIKIDIDRVKTLSVEFSNLFDDWRMIHNSNTLAIKNSVDKTITALCSAFERTTKYKNA